MPETAGTTLQTPQGIEARLKADVIPGLIPKAQAKPGSGVGQSEPAPAQAAPPPVTPPAAAPVTPPAPPAPPPPPAVAAPDPQVAELLQRLERVEAENRNLRNRKIEVPEIKLPATKEQLDAMPQGEAIALMAQALGGHMRAAVEAVNQGLTSFEAEKLDPLRDNLNAVRKRDAETSLKGKFPRLDLEKYRPKFEDVLRRHRTLNFEEAIRMVADPADLMPADAPMTPAAASVAHVETGLPARTASIPAATPKPPSASELMAQAAEARRSGNPHLANKLQEQALKVKLDL